MFMIVVQAVLGGLTVLYQLPGWISTLHFLLAHLTFAGMLYLSWYFSGSSSSRDRASYSSAIRTLAPMTLLVVFFQMGLGAWLRHIGSKGPPLAPVCEAFPWCNPKWITVMTADYLWTYWFHRSLSIGVVLMVAGLALVLMRDRGVGSVDFKLSYLAAFVVLVQAVIGVLTVRSSLSVLFTMLHTAGALMLFTILLWENFRISSSIQR
jgi:heme A synthase